MEPENNEQHNHTQKPGALFIPAGVLVGLGVGFLVNNVSAGLFIGLGAGFVLFAISLLIKKK